MSENRRRKGSNVSSIASGRRKDKTTPLVWISAAFHSVLQHCRLEDHKHTRPIKDLCHLSQRFSFGKNGGRKLEELAKLGNILYEVYTVIKTTLNHTHQHTHYA